MPYTNTQNIQKHLQGDSEWELARRKQQQLCSSALLVPSPTNTVQGLGLATASPGDAPAPCGCANTGTTSTTLACTDREARLTHTPVPLQSPRRGLMDIARAHSKVILGTLPSLLASRPVTRQHPPSTRQTHPSSYWSRAKLSSLQPSHLPKPLSLQNNSR